MNRGAQRESTSPAELGFISGFLGFSIAQAKDSTELSLARRKVFEDISFYCLVGRTPIRSSVEAWGIQPTDTCSFAGPLDTLINRRKLEPPILNPQLSLKQLADFLSKLGIEPEESADESFSFRLPSGEVFRASWVAASGMTDTVLKLAAYPAQWGGQFVSILGDDRAAIEKLIAFANTPQSPLFWNNPYLAEESTTLPRLQGERTYSPLRLLSKCGDGSEWREFGGKQSLLLVGDMHVAADTIFFKGVVQGRPLAWVALEMTRDRDGDLQGFLAATDPAEESRELEILLSRRSADVLQPTRDLLRALKAQKVNIILIDYEEDYFNFPYTDTSFHGLVVGTRNLLWTNRLPATWSGTAALLGGLDHFAITPHADFQDFANLRFPGLDMALINPLEQCH